MPYSTEHDEIPNPLRPGLRAESAPEPCALVIFGATGDLAHRKLIPALYNLAVTGHLPAASGIVGVAKSELPTEQFVSGMRESVGTHSRTKPIDAEVWQDFAAGLRYLSGSFDDSGTFARLRSALDELDRSRGTRGNRLYYFATPPSAFPVLLKQLKGANLITSPSDSRRGSSSLPSSAAGMASPHGSPAERACPLPRWGWPAGSRPRRRATSLPAWRPLRCR